MLARLRAKDLGNAPEAVHRLRASSVRWNVHQGISLEASVHSIEKERFTETWKRMAAGALEEACARVEKHIRITVHNSCTLVGGNFRIVL